MAEIQKIDESKVKETFGASCIDLISASLGGEILSFSDEFFAAASNLLTPTPPVHRPGVFVETGAWYDGWETRRHNPEDADWVIVKLGVPSGVIHGVEIDTAFFNGNHASAVSVSGVFRDGGAPPAAGSEEWEPILPMQPCGPSQRHVWRLARPTDKAYSHVKLSMYPDGGIARFRLFGTAVPVFPTDPEAVIDLAHVASGALAVAHSDEHYGKAANLLLPGRGSDMGDGWETARNREPGHRDWVVVRLGAAAYVEEVIVDTLHFRGNFPQAVEVYGCYAPESHIVPGDDARWEILVERAPCAKDTEHAFSSTVLKGLGEGTDRRKISHVMMCIYPDGGVKRLRVFGKRVLGEVDVRP